MALNFSLVNEVLSAIKGTGNVGTWLTCTSFLRPLNDRCGDVMRALDLYNYIRLGMQFVNIRSIMKTIATISEAVAALLLLYLCGCGSANDCELGIVPNL